MRTPFWGKSAKSGPLETLTEDDRGSGDPRSGDQGTPNPKANWTIRPPLIGFRAKKGVFKVSPRYLTALTKVTWGRGRQGVQGYPEGTQNDPFGVWGRIWTPENLVLRGSGIDADPFLGQIGQIWTPGNLNRG